MTIVPYNVRSYDTPDGGKLFQPYYPEHPYIGCPCYQSRREAIEYIANSCGFSYQEFMRCKREGRIGLCQSH